MRAIDNGPSDGPKGQDRFHHFLQATLRLILAGVAARGAAISALDAAPATPTTSGAHE